MAPLGLIVAVEDVLQFLLGNADARVGHGELQAGQSLLLDDAGPDADGAALGGELEGVGEQVAQDALHVVGREPDVLAVVLGRHAELQAAAAGGLGETLYAAGDELQGVALLYIEGELVGLDLIERDEFIDERLHLAGVLDGHGQVGAVLLAQLLTGDAAQGGDDERQRRLELMADGGEEVELGAVDLLDLGLLHAGQLHLVARPHAAVDDAPCHVDQGGGQEGIEEEGPRGEVEGRPDDDDERALGHLVPPAVRGVGPQVEPIGAGAQVVAIEAALAADAVPVAVDALEPLLILDGAVLPGLYDAILDGERAGLVVAQADGVGIVESLAERRVDALGRDDLPTEAEGCEVDGERAQVVGLTAVS